MLDIAQTPKYLSVWILEKLRFSLLAGFSHMTLRDTVIVRRANAGRIPATFFMPKLLYTLELLIAQ